jgi:hypothetical protein
MKYRHRILFGRFIHGLVEEHRDKDFWDSLQALRLLVGRRHQRKVDDPAKLVWMSGSDKSPDKLMDVLALRTEDFLDAPLVLLVV